MKMTTFSGHSVTPLAPEKVEIMDIGHALSMLCRYTGHSTSFYSVAEHSVLVSHLVPPEFALEGLLHDAHEAYIGDIGSPLKSHLREFKGIDVAVQAHVLAALEIQTPLPPEVKAADERAAEIEMEVLWGGKMDSRIECLAPAMARHRFLVRYIDLASKRLLAATGAVGSSADAA